MNQSRWTKRAQFVGLVVILLFVVLLSAAGGPVFTASAAPLAATSPTLGAAASYSVLGGAAVTCLGPTTTSGRVGVSPGTLISGFPVPCTAGGGTHSNDTSAINAQAANVTAFGALNQTCGHNYASGQDLTLISPLGPGVYCSAGSFKLTKNLHLTGSGVWIFKTVSTLITSPDSSVTGGDPCNVWWRIGSAATLDLNTSFIGNILTADVADTTAMNTGATLNGRILSQAAATVTLDSNTITGPVCAAPPPSPATQTAVAATQTVIAVIHTATAISLLPTRTPGPGGNQATSTPGPGGNQATSAPTEILGATATPTQVVNTLLPTTGGSGSNGLSLVWLALGVAGAALVGFPLLLRRRR